MIFAEFGVIRTFGLSVRIAGVKRAQAISVVYQVTGTLLMYAAVAIIPATSSLRKTPPIFHGGR